MTEENKAKSTCQTTLTKEQFEINENGEVIIRSEDVVEALRSQLELADSIEAGSINTIEPITIGIVRG